MEKLKAHPWMLKTGPQCDLEQKQKIAAKIMKQREARKLQR